MNPEASMQYRESLLEKGRRYQVRLDCLHWERAFPIAPTLTIPECHNGYVMIDESFYKEYPQIKAKKSTKLSPRMNDRMPAHFLVGEHSLP